MFSLSLLLKNTLEKNNKCCQTKITKNTVCVNWGKIFHLSCAVKNKLKCDQICDIRMICYQPAKQVTKTTNDIVNKKHKELYSFPPLSERKILSEPSKPSSKEIESETKFTKEEKEHEDIIAINQEIIASNNKFTLSKKDVKKIMFS